VADAGLWQQDAAAGGSRWLEGEAVPAGAWALVHGERQLTIEFETEHVAKCLPSWERAGEIVRLDMYGKPTRLNPQQAVRIRQVWTPEARRV